MSLPAAWVDALFHRLAVRYGASFARQWEGLDLAAVKADWADELAYYADHPAAIAGALRELPADFPPNAMQFRALCARALPAAPALPAPEVRAEPERVRELIAQAVDATRDLRTPAQRCVANIHRAAAERGGKLTIPQKQQLQAMGVV